MLCKVKDALGTLIDLDDMVGMLFWPERFDSGHDVALEERLTQGQAARGRRRDLQPCMSFLTARAEPVAVLWHLRRTR